MNALTATAGRGRARTRRRTRLLTVAAAAAAPAAIWILVVPVLGHRLSVSDNTGGQPLEIGVVAVIILAVAAGLAGWALLAALERLTRFAVAVWTITAVLILVVSFLPLSAPGTGTSTRVTLGLMHLTVAAILIPVFVRTSPRAAASAASR